MESILVERSVSGGILFRSLSSSYSLDQKFPILHSASFSSQPPLLPLPSVDPTWPALSPSKGRAANGRQPRQKKTRHASASPKKAVPIHVVAPEKRVTREETKSVIMVAKEELLEEKEEVVWKGSVYDYSVSPPPSSVPMPRFCLVKGKEETGKATKEKGGVDDNATNELRRLLRL